MHGSSSCCRSLIIWRTAILRILTACSCSADRRSETTPEKSASSAVTARAQSSRIRSSRRRDGTWKYCCRLKAIPIQSLLYSPRRICTIPTEPLLCSKSHPAENEGHGLVARIVLFQNKDLGGEVC